jgi:hypothetical protein
MINARRADKIILHGLFKTDLIAMTILQPWIHKKCFWVIWGGDLYDYRMAKQKNKSRIQERLKKLLIPRLGNVITHIEGDYKLAQLWYDVEGKWHQCFMYPSNLYKEFSGNKVAHEGVNILLGNSATSTNNHMEALDKLSSQKRDDIRIYCPLSYGDDDYAKEVEKTGRKLFGEKFICLKQFIPIDYYIEFLSNMDIAIFNNNRQQAMGTIRTLLGLGKKVYINKSTTQEVYLRKQGLKIFTLDNLSLDPDFPEKEQNIETTKRTYSKEKLIHCLREIFDN